MKKFLASICVLLILPGIFISYPKRIKAYAELPSAGPKTEAKAAYLMEAETFTPIYAHNENKRLPIASMAKIMTLLLCYEHIDSGAMSKDDLIVVSENAAGMGGSQAFLDANKEYKVDDLLKSISVASANDASVAMAEAISGSVEGFVEAMNQRAKELGLENTHFSNCTGLPAPDNYSSAKDCAVMLANLIKHRDYFRHSTIWMEDLVHPGGRVTGLTNTNKLIRFYEGCDGGKTGYTSEAGHCLSATALRGGLRLISVVIGAPDSKTRFRDVSNLLNHGFANYERKVLVKAGEPLEQQAKVKLGKKDTLQAASKEDISIFKMRKEGLKSVEIKTEFDNIKAPVKKGDTVGKICVYYNGELYKSAALLSCEDVQRLGYKDIVKKFFGNFSGRER